MNKKEQIQMEIDSCKENLLRLETLLKEEENKHDSKQWLLDFLSQKFIVRLFKGYITYYNIKGQFVFQQDSQNKVLWVSNNVIWRVLKEQNAGRYLDIQQLIKDVVCKALNCEEYTVCRR